MVQTSTKPLKVFCSYSREDTEYLEALDTWLIDLKRESLIEEWYDGKIGPGEEWDKAIEEHLNTSDIIIFLVSQDFMRSDYVYEKEILPAIEKHNRGEARVIPIIVRQAIWKKAFGNLLALPKDGTPIVKWSQPDDAWLDVAEKVEEEVRKLAKRKSKRQQATDEVRDALIDQPMIQGQVNSMEAGPNLEVASGPRESSESRASNPDPRGTFRRPTLVTTPGQAPEPEVIDGLNDRVRTLYENNRLEEAEKYNQIVLYLRVDDPVAWYSRGLIMARWGLHNEALDAFEEAARRRQHYPDAWSAMVGNSSERNGVA